MKTSVKWVVLACLVCTHVDAADEITVQAAVAAVHVWYDTLSNGSDQEHLTEFGTVGGGVGPLIEAYQQLAVELKQHMDRGQFLVHYRGLARMHLLQAYPVLTSAHDNYVHVFVEEERTMAIEGVPVMAWFEGTIELTKGQDGWKISSLENVKPEDLIDALGDHTPWHDDPVDVAMARAGCKSEVCSVLKKALPPNSTERMARVTIQSLRGVDTISLARLHDGEWLPIDMETEANSASK